MIDIPSDEGSDGGSSGEDSTAISDYAILDKVGGGSFGSVYRAFSCKDPGQAYVLKKTPSKLFFRAGCRGRNALYY